MIGTPEYTATIRGALNWLVAQKDASGTWHSTQATVLALKALLAGTGQPLGGETERQIEITVDDQPARTTIMPADQSEVMKQIDLSQQVATGKHHIRLSERGDGGSIYQLVFRYYTPGPAATTTRTSEPLQIEVAYDRTELSGSFLPDPP